MQEFLGRHHPLFKHRRRHHHHRHHPAPVPVPAPVPTPVPTPTPTPTPTPPPGATAPQWPTYTGTSQFVGTSPTGVSVYVDPTLGAQGLQNAEALLADADRIAVLNNQIFGITGNNVNVIVFALGGATDGTGGADHMACSFTDGGNIEVDVSFGSPERIGSLFEAELSECAMGGNLCGVSTGESLSRWCAMVTDNNALADFATAPAWVAAGTPDYVNQVDPTDQDALSIGCGMAFLSWLMSQGHNLPAVAQAMVNDGDAGTLAALYARLTGNPATGAWAAFNAAIAALPGGAAGIMTDDPFGALATALPAAGA